MVIRLYLSALTLIFLLAAFSRGVELLEGFVVVCALLYLILDTREHLKALKTEVRKLKRLEKKLSIQPR